MLSTVLLNGWRNEAVYNYNGEMFEMSNSICFY